MPVPDSGMTLARKPAGGQRRGLRGARGRWPAARVRSRSARRGSPGPGPWRPVAGTRSDLAVGGRLPPGKRPVIGEALDARDHAGGQLGQLAGGEVRAGWLVRYPQPVDPELLPRLAGAGRAKIGAAVLLAAADDRGRYPLGAAE